MNRKSEDLEQVMLTCHERMGPPCCEDLESRLQAIGLDLATLLEDISALDEINQLPLASELERPHKSIKDRLMTRVRSNSATAA